MWDDKKQIYLGGFDQVRVLGGGELGCWPSGTGPPKTFRFPFQQSPSPPPLPPGGARRQGARRHGPQDARGGCRGGAGGECCRVGARKKENICTRFNHYLSFLPSSLSSTSPSPTTPSSSPSCPR